MKQIKLTKVELNEGLEEWVQLTYQVGFKRTGILNNEIVRFMVANPKKGTYWYCNNRHDYFTPEKDNEGNLALINNKQYVLARARYLMQYKQAEIDHEIAKRLRAKHTELESWANDIPTSQIPASHTEVFIQAKNLKDHEMLHQLKGIIQDSFLEANLIGSFKIDDPAGMEVLKKLFHADKVEETIQNLTKPQPKSKKEIDPNAGLLALQVKVEVEKEYTLPF